MERRFAVGASIIVREVLRGRAWSTRSAIVVRDMGDEVVTYVPPGAPCMTPIGPCGAYDRAAAANEVRWELRPWEHTHALSISRADEPWSTRVYWHERDWSHVCWYVNIEEPWRRTPLGFDTMDDELDIVVHPDRSHEWKDEDMLAHWVERGVYTSADAARIRANGERALRTVVAWSSPLSDGWESWRPDPSWALPDLPADWAHVA